MGQSFADYLVRFPGKTRSTLRRKARKLAEKTGGYLSLPVAGDTLVCAHLGYDPDHTRLSPGTELQMDALKKLFAEGRYRWFDFTEGEGAHKAMFGTHSASCRSLMLLRPTLANRA